MDERQEDLGRSVCIVLLTTTTFLSAYYSLIRIAILITALVYKVRTRVQSLRRNKKKSSVITGSSDDGQEDDEEEVIVTPRRYRKIWRLVTEILPPALYVLISLSALWGFLFNNLKWIVVPLVFALLTLLFDSIYVSVGWGETRDSVGSVLYHMTVCHLLFVIIISCTAIYHLVRVSKLKTARMFTQDEQQDMPADDTVAPNCT